MTRLTPVQMEAIHVLGDGEMTAEEVAKVANRTRPLMVINLNQLVALGLLERERRGRCVYFKQRRVEPPRIC